MIAHVETTQCIAVNVAIKLFNSQTQTMLSVL